jgi:hypothetical protein
MYYEVVFDSFNTKKWLAKFFNNVYLDTSWTLHPASSDNCKWDGNSFWVFETFMLVYVELWSKRRFSCFRMHPNPNHVQARSHQPIIARWGRKERGCTNRHTMARRTTYTCTHMNAGQCSTSPYLLNSQAWAPSLEFSVLNSTISHMQLYRDHFVTLYFRNFQGPHRTKQY